jgi:hypothetical protein
LNLAGHRRVLGVRGTLAVLVGRSEVRHVDIWFVGCGVVVIVEELIDAGKESLSPNERICVYLYLRATATAATYHLSSCRHC